MNNDTHDTDTINAARKVCPDRDWCEMENYPDSEHAEFHASAILDLAHYSRDSEGRETGWWCWLVENRGDRPCLAIEGKVDGKHFDTQVPVVDVAILLAAVETPQARTELETLIARVTS